MSRSKTKEPLESFAPEMKEVLMRAAKGEEITLEFPTEKMAHVFRRRIHTLRQRLRADAPDDYVVACRCEVGPPVPKDQKNQGPLYPCTMTLRLKDSEFVGILKKAGVEAPALEADPIMDLPITDEDLRS